MKRIHILLLLICISAFSQAQLRSDSLPVRKKTASSNSIKTQTSTNTRPATSSGQVNAAVIMQPQAAKLSKIANPYYQPTTHGRDLRIIINRVEDLSVSGANNYNIEYTVINSGTEPIDISHVELQGYFYNSSNTLVGPAGAVVLIPEILGTQKILQSGYGFTGKLGSSSDLLMANNQYKLVVKMDNRNTVAEANENNNTAEAQVTGHGAPKPVQQNFGDVSLIIDSIRLRTICSTCPPAYYAFYTVTNTSNYPVDLKNHYGVQAKIGIPGTNTSSPAGGHLLLAEGITLLPGNKFHGSTSLSYNFESRRTYIAILELFPKFGINEGNLNDNKAETWFTTN